MTIDNKFNAFSRTTGEQMVEFQYEDILCKVLSEDRPIMHPEFVVESAGKCIPLPTNPTDGSCPSQSDARSSKLVSSHGEDNSSSTSKTRKIRVKSIENSPHLLREDMKASENVHGDGGKVNEEERGRGRNETEIGRARNSTNEMGRGEQETGKVSRNFSAITPQEQVKTERSLFRQQYTCIYVRTVYS